MCGCRNGYKYITKINWELYINEPFCVDIDECSNRDVCPKKSTCRNTDGSYICQCDQGSGGDHCEDINECNQTSTCDPNAKCLNMEGSFICSCNLGYRGNGTTCKLGQCDDRRCPPDQKCVSSTSDKCQCNQGLIFNTIYEFCEDIDECLFDHDCDQNSTCVNIKGSYTCICNPGYIGDGKICEEGTCTDDMCPMNQECVMPTSHNCRCKHGFKLKSWKANQTDICVDTDECSTLKGICHEKAVCRNFPGGYECNCQFGYFGDGQTCFPGSCTDINCPPSDGKECVSPRSNLCKCREGYEFDNSSVCVDVDECRKGLCDKNANCANEPGNFSCSCSIGYAPVDAVSCTNKTVVLVLITPSPSGSYKPPLLVDAEGRSDSDIVMSFGTGTEVFNSCSVSFRNKFYVFGGRDETRQISEVAQCQLRRVGTLDFDHYFAACTNVDNREIYLCFDYNDEKQCRSSVDPLGNFTEIAASTYDHRHARTAASPG